MHLEIPIVVLGVYFSQGEGGVAARDSYHSGVDESLQNPKSTVSNASIKVTPIRN